MTKLRGALQRRDDQIAEARKQAEEERQAIDVVGEERVAIYANLAELVRHARVVDHAEIEENEFNLNIPRYVDTFAPEEPIDVNQALRELDEAETALSQSVHQLRRTLRIIGYEC